MPVTYETLLKLRVTTFLDANKHDAATTIWLKKNSMVIGLLQGTILPALWPDFANDVTAKALWDACETRFGKVGGTQTYLQLVNMITIKISRSSTYDHYCTDSTVVPMWTLVGTVWGHSVLSMEVSRAHSRHWHSQYRP